jgi:IMP dehydrogenase
MDSRFENEALTFDDVLLVPGHSEVLPHETDTGTFFSRRIPIGIPVVSAAMDTVTDANLAIAIAREGGLGVLHRNLSPEAQAAEVDLVKRSESGMIRDPITLAPDRPISEALALMAKYRISGIPITRDGRLVGILTNRDLRFVERTDVPVEEAMTKERIVTAPEGTTLEEAKAILHKNRIEKLPVVDREFRLKGLITVKDIKKRHRRRRGERRHARGRGVPDRRGSRRGEGRHRAGRFVHDARRRGCRRAADHRDPRVRASDGARGDPAHRRRRHQVLRRPREGARGGRAERDDRKPLRRNGGIARRGRAV